MLGRLSTAFSAVLKEQKPWPELLDRSVMSKPANVGEAVTRIRRNVKYFRINYLVIMLASTAVSFLMHPTSLFMLALLAASWVYVLFIRQTPIVFGERTLTDREKVLGMSAISFIMIFFLTSVGTVFFSALAFSAAVISVHGACREPDHLFMDDVEADQSFMSMLTGAPASATLPV